MTDSEVEVWNSAFKALLAQAGDIRDPDILAQMFEGVDWPPRVFAQAVMQGVDEVEQAFFDVDHKIFWMEVGTHMGPDYTEALRKATAFMIKVGQF